MTTAEAAAVPAARSRFRPAWEALRPHLPALAFLALMALAYWHRIDTWRIDDDEEGYLYAAWRISRGELPYRDFLTPQLPAFLFPGGLAIALFGPQAAVLRAWSAVLMLVAGYATYLTGRRLYGPAAGLAALAVVLLSDDLFPLARAWRPEATMLACGALALYAFVRADAPARRSGYALASLLFGLGLLAKLFGFLPWAATGAYLAVDALTGGRPARRAAGDLAALALPGLALVALVMGGFQLLTPETYHAVLEHHLRQGAELSRAQALANTLDFYGRALGWHAPLLAFVPLGLVSAWKLAGRRGLVVPWQLPTVLAFMLLTRTLFARHLVYLLPALGLLLGAAVAWLLGRLDAPARLRTLVGATLVATVVLPFVVDDLESYAREEVGTARLATMIQALAPAGSRILADYPGIAFYGGRDTTYSGAGLSEGAAESGQITGERLWDEMQAGDVSLVLIDQDTQNGQLKDLVDFEAWQGRVQADYRRLGKFYRQYQPLDVYRRNDQAGLGLDFGPLNLESATVDRTEVEAGDDLDVTAVLVADERPEEAYTAFLHLVGPDGQTVATGDTFLDNALYRGSEEWEAGEVVAVPMALSVPAGIPPGRYTLEFGLYDAASGDRRAWTAPDGSAGDSWPMGELTVTVPAEPGPLSATRPVAVVGPYNFLGAHMPSPGAVQAGGLAQVHTAWQANRPPGADHRLRFVAYGMNDVARGETIVDPAAWSWPTSRWRRGEDFTISPRIRIDPTAPNDMLFVKATWIDEAGQPLGPWVHVGSGGITRLPQPVTEPPVLSRPITATVGTGLLQLLGSDLPASAAAGMTLPVTLAWRAVGTPSQALTTLLHVVDGAGLVVAQADGAPDRPTTSWRSGEVITDTRRLTLPADLAPGDYTVLAGLYDAADPAYPRLPTMIDGVRRIDGRVPLGTIEVTAP
jgi:hypothetical protein